MQAGSGCFHIPLIRETSSWTVRDRQSGRMFPFSLNGSASFTSYATGMCVLGHLASVTELPTWRFQSLATSVAATVNEPHNLSHGPASLHEVRPEGSTLSKSKVV